MRAALYLRVSTREQTTDNQRIALEALCKQRGWEIVQVYEDAGISGAKGRDKRPGFDMALKDATRGRYDVLVAWAVDRLGRSLTGLLDALQALHGAHVGLVLHQQGLDTTTPAGRAMFQMLGVFAEFERSLIQERVYAGLDNARRKGIHLGRRFLDEEKAEQARKLFSQGYSINAVAKTLRIGNSAAARVRKEMEDEK
jgi:Site-specific recombinases, DNA invertase Pin homologs